MSYLRYYILAVFFISAVITSANNSTTDTASSEKLSLKAKQALAFCKTKGYSNDFCILIDLSIHSGKKRFFIWDFKRQKITHTAMVSHGCGKMPWGWAWSKESPVFSNKDGSHCSSLGKYKIGKRGYSNWGIHVNYLLYGLENTNSNALARQIVLHSWEQVPDNEVYPKGTPEGWGCPAVSNSSMRVIDGKLKVSKKPVLLWVYI